MASSRPIADPVIQKLIADASKLADDAPGIGTIVEEILLLLKATGLTSYGIRIPSSQVCVHRDNRYGFGVMVKRSHKLGRKILKIGFLWEACSLCVCIQEPDTKENARFTIKLQAKSDGFAKQKEHEITHASLGGGHLNQLLNCVMQGVPCEYESLCIDGKMSLAKIVAKDTKFGDAISNGLSWCVLHKDCDALYPGLCNLIQRQRNAIAQNHSSEGVAELLAEVQKLATEMQDDDTLNIEPNWQVIEQIVLQSEPPRPEEVPTICQFVQKFGGGKNGQYVKMMIEFMACCVPDDREIAASFLRAFNDLKLQEHELCPDFVAAAIMCQANCPQEDVKHGVCSFIKDTSVTKLEKSLKESMIEANRTLKEFKKWIFTTALSEKHRVAFHGKTACLIVRLLFDLPRDSEASTYGGVCHLTAEEVIKIMITKVSNPWSKEEEEAEELAHPATSAKRLVHYNEEGEAEGLKKVLLENQGFVAGSRVQVTEGKDGAGAIFFIKGIDKNGDVRMYGEGQDGTLATKIRRSNFDIFLGKYKLLSSKKKIVLQYPMNDICSSDAFGSRDIEAQITIVMTEAYRLIPSQSIMVVEKPSKGIFAKEEHDKNTLVIPIYGKVYVANEEDGMPSTVGCFEVKAHGFQGKLVYVKTSAATDHGVTPAAFVKVVDDEEKATAKIEWKSIAFFKEFARAKGASKVKQGIRMPVIINHCYLDMDAEVSIYREPQEKAKKEPSKNVAVDCGFMSKRLRTA